MEPWLTGPEAATALAQWCEAHNLPVQHVLSAMTPPLARSTVLRWRRGAEPERGTWLRLRAQLDELEAQQQLAAVLGG